MVLQKTCKYCTRTEVTFSIWPNEDRGRILIDHSSSRKTLRRRDGRHLWRGCGDLCLFCRRRILVLNRCHCRGFHLVLQNSNVWGDWFENDFRQSIAHFFGPSSQTEITWRQVRSFGLNRELEQRHEHEAQSGYQTPFRCLCLHNEETKSVTNCSHLS